MAPRMIPSLDTEGVTRETGRHPEIWLGRVICLALMVGAWLGFAAFVESWTVETDLLARGKTTVAKMTREEKSRARGRIALFPRMAYYYEVEGREYKDSTSGKEYPEGQAITYLPEVPGVHRLGVIRPRSAAKDIGFALIWAILASPLTLGFVGFSVLSAGPGEDPNRQGWRIILVLWAAQHALVFTTLFLVRQPFSVVLTQYVPAFVGGSIGIILGVRYFAGRWGVELEKRRSLQDVRETISVMDPRRGTGAERFQGRASRRFVPRPEPSDPAGPNAGDGCVAGNAEPAGVTACPVAGGGPPSEEERADARATPGRFRDADRPADSAPRAGTPPGPTQHYHVTLTPGGGFVRTATAAQIREQLRSGGLLATCYAAESDGRSFDDFQRGGGGRWRTLAELLAEWGEKPPPLAPPAVRVPWHAAPRAALAGAVACLLASIAGSLFLHAVAFLFLLGGASWSWVAFFTGTDSILMDLILATVATTFGAIRGVAHHAGQLPGSRTYGDIAERAFSDLGSIRGGTSESFVHRLELIACLFLAAILASPVIVIILLVWFRS